MSTHLPDNWIIKSEEEKNAVREQLERILKHPAFKNSLRSARFLRYVVEYWLLNENNEELLKERTLGAELFGLDPAYDTNQYTVVRNAASDVRKRIALYYHEPGHEEEIHIEIPAGSYIPSFHRSALVAPGADEFAHEAATAKGEEDSGSIGQGILSSGQEEKGYRKRNHLYLALLAFVVLVAVASVAGWVYHRSYQGGNASSQGGSLSASQIGDRSELDRFWQPVLSDAPFEPVIIVCVEQLPPQPGITQVVMPAGDAFAAADFARLLGFKDARFRIALANYVTINDVQAATILMVGGVGNRWTSYVTDGLRFHFAANASTGSKESVWIEDRKNPTKMDWSLTPSSAASGILHDYAIVARVKDPKTGRWRVIAAGLDAVATGVAARLLVDANYLKELTSRLPDQWRSKENIEAVISVQVVNGEAGYPQIVAYEVW